MTTSTTSDMQSTTQEPILMHQSNRFTYFPTTYPQIHEAYKRAVATFWTPEEINFGQDRTDWQKLTSQEQHFIKHILAFFAGSDGIVMENLAKRFMSDIELPEVRAFYSYQLFIEQIHSETYSLLLDTYIQDAQEKHMLFNAIETVPCVKKKAEWAMKWINSTTATFPQRLLGFAAVEGIFFSGSFCAIFWIRSTKKGLGPALTYSNELISRDEGMHTDFAVLLYSMLVNKLPKEMVFDLIKEAVEIEKEFVTEALSCKLIGMNADLMKQYIEFVADRLLIQIGYEKIYKVANPFSFMELISLRQKNNFFEVKVSEYTKAGVGTNSKDREFVLDEKF